MTIAHVSAELEFGSAMLHRNLATPQLIEAAISRREGVLASNGALNVDTGERTGRSPNDKLLEDSPAVHEQIDWGTVNQPIGPEHFATLESRVREYLARRTELFRFDGPLAQGRLGPVRGAPDISGDGVPDVLVGGPGTTGTLGRVYILSGTDGSIVVGQSVLEIAALRELLTQLVREFPD